MTQTKSSTAVLTGDHSCNWPVPQRPSSNCRSIPAGGVFASCSRCCRPSSGAVAASPQSRDIHVVLRALGWQLGQLPPQPKAKQQQTCYICLNYAAASVMHRYTSTIVVNYAAVCILHLSKLCFCSNYASASIVHLYKQI